MAFRALFNSALKQFRLHCLSDLRKMRHPGRSIRTVHYCYSAVLVVLSLAVLSSSIPVHAQSYPPSRPILFVHGFCGDAESWTNLAQALSASLATDHSSLYPNVDPSGNQLVYKVYYDSVADQVYFIDPNTGDKVDEFWILPNTRFFEMAFYDSANQTFDSTDVANISVLNKAYELSRAIKEITKITRIKDVIVVAHSMGGLVARAYMANLGSVGDCWDPGTPSVPDYTQQSCTPGQPPAAYTDDIADLITIDTPHGGTLAATDNHPVIGTILDNCALLPSASKTEMIPGSSLLQTLNLFGDPNGQLPSNTIPSVPIQSLESYFSNEPNPSCPDPPQSNNGTTFYCDDLISTIHQAIKTNINPSYLSLYPTWKDIGNPFNDQDNQIAANPDCFVGYSSTTNTGWRMLHMIQCLGDQPQTRTIVYQQIDPIVQGQPTSLTVQAMYNGQPWSGSLSYTILTQDYSSINEQSVPVTLSNVGVETYSIPSYDISGGPAGAGPPTVTASPSPTIQPGQWAVTFTIAFTDKKVSSTSISASLLQAAQGVAVSFTATVQSGSQVPTGTVVFYDGSAVLSSPIALNTSGAAPFSTSALAVGSHSITVHYSGDSNFAASNSSPITVTVGGVSPNIAASPQSGTIGVTVFTKSGTGFTPNGAITHTATWPDNSKSVLNGYADSTGSFSYTVTYSGETGTYYQTDTDNTTGKPSNTISWTVSPVAINDFSLSPSPGSETISQGGSATFSLVTATISGSAQSVSLSASNAPSGMTVSFSQSVIASGGSVTFTVSAGSSVPAGTYLLTITGTGTSATHSSTVSVTVVQQQSGSAGSLASSPTSFNFNSQTVDTASSPVVFSLVNSGGSAVTISSLTASPGFIPSFLNGLGIPITLQPNGGYANMQVVFIPTSAGTQTGTIKLFNSTNASPLTISLSGSGIGAPVTTGNIQINATFNGSPWSGNLYTSLTGPESYTDGQTPITHTELAPGGYTESYSAGGPGGATLQSITPSASQTLTAGSTVTFTYNFTGTNTFNIGDPQPITTVMGLGKSAQIQLPQLCLVTGAAQTIQFAMQGLPLGASVAWSANPLSLTGCGQTETATVTSSATTPPGVYSIQITGTNQSGSTSTTSAWLSMNLPPASPDVLVSVASNGTQGNGDSGGTVVSGSAKEYDPISVSADGHVIAFTSSATNLVSQNVGGLLVRDTNTGTTILGSAAADGSPASGAFPSLSADGKILVFASSSSNLPNPATYGSTQGIYVRDFSAGTITRVDMASDGTPGNGISSYSSISADGRFVAFQSTASNLLPAASSGGAFVYDRKTGSMKLASISSDESIQADGESPRISASGRYVLFASSNPNLVPNDTNGRTDAFVHDFVTGETTRVNVASDGTQDTCGVSTTISSPLAISADGRYVAFQSCGDLVQGYADPRGDGGDVYVHDMVTGQTSPLGIDQVGDLLNTQTVGGFSADGRFIAVNGSIIDQTTGEMTRVDVLSDGSGSPAVTNTLFYGGDTTTAFLTSDGSHTVFASNASNLVSNDNNGYFDVFEGVNSFLASPRLASISLSANQDPGGSSVTGTLTLNAPAPTGGAAVSVWTDNTAAQSPATVVVPSGATSATFSITTSVVPVESVVAVVASYNSGSNVAVLALEPAAVLTTSPSSWSFGSIAVGTKSTAESFVLSNSGTASLAISSIQMATGQAFTISANTCGLSIAPGASCSVSVTFAPSSTGTASDSVQITYGMPATIQSIAVTGQGGTPVAILSPLPLNFGSQLMPGSNAGTATLTNNGSANLTNISTAISGANSSDFTISSDGCSGVILPANSSCSVSITFTPKAKGTRAATLSITDNASGSPQTASLTGVGVQSAPAILWTPSTVSLTYGTALGGILNASAQGNGSTLAGTFAYTATITNGTPKTVNQTTVLTAGTYTITATFTPTDTVDYATATTTMSIIVTDATPVVTVIPGASSVSANQPLAVAITVNGGAGNPTPTGSVVLTGGSYASSAATLSGGSTTINIPGNTLTAGNYNFKATYTPDTNSLSTYGSASGTATASVTVTPAPTFLVSNGGAITIVQGAVTGNTSTITLTPSNGFTGAVDLSCQTTSSPSGATSPVTCGIPLSVSITGTSAQTAALTASSTATTTPGSYSITVTAKSGSITQTTLVNVTVTTAVAGTFSISNSGTITVDQGATTGDTAAISVTPSNGFTGAVNLSCQTTSSPNSATSPVTCSIPSSVSITGTNAQTATLTANSTTTTTPGNYAITVTAQSGSITQTTVVNVTVTSVPGFTEGSGGTISITVTKGSTSGNTATISIVGTNGFSGVVNLNCNVTSTMMGVNDMPTCTLNPNSVTLSGATAQTSTLTVNTTAATSSKNEIQRLLWPTTGGTTLALVALFLVPRRRRTWLVGFGMFFLIIACTMTSCGGGGGTGSGGGGGGNSGTTVGNYTVTVTGTSGTISATVGTVTLTVQ